MNQSELLENRIYFPEQPVEIPVKDFSLTEPKSFLLIEADEDFIRINGDNDNKTSFTVEKSKTGIKNLEQTVNLLDLSDPKIFHNENVILRFFYGDGVLGCLNAENDSQLSTIKSLLTDVLSILSQEKNLPESIKLNPVQVVENGFL